MVPSLVIALLASGPPQQHKDTVHELVKEAVTSGSADGGVDVSRLPFTSESIKQIVLSHQPRIQACYEEHLAQQKKKVPEGILKTRFLITADGYVKDAKVIRAKSAIKDAQLQDCVVAVLSTMEFPKPPSGKSQPVEFPFNLKAQR
jgi:hypothetical protein